LDNLLNTLSGAVAPSTIETIQSPKKLGWQDFVPLQIILAKLKNLIRINQKTVSVALTTQPTIQSFEADGRSPTTARQGDKLE